MSIVEKLSVAKNNGINSLVNQIIIFLQYLRILVILLGDWSLVPPLVELLFGPDHSLARILLLAFFERDLV